MTLVRGGDNLLGRLRILADEGDRVTTGVAEAKHRVVAACSRWPRARSRRASSVRAATWDGLVRTAVFRWSSASSALPCPSLIRANR